MCFPPERIRFEINVPRRTPNDWADLVIFGDAELKSPYFVFECKRADLSDAEFAQSIEGKVEYRFPLLSPDRLSLRAGLDPAASALRCGKTVRGFAPTPQQVGFSLFRSWVF